MIVTGCNHSRIRSLTVMETKLFRSQAVEHQKNRLHGDAIVTPRISHSLIVLFLLVWVAVVFLWLISNSYARKETVVGWLEPSAGVIRVYPEDTGTIKKVLVSEGDFVEKNQPLLIINGDRILTDGGNMEENLLNEYEVQKSLVNEQLARSNTIYKSQAKIISEKIHAAESELLMLKEQMTMLSRKHALISNQVERMSVLKKDGHISGYDYESVLSQELAVRIDIHNLTISKISKENLIGQMQSESNFLLYENQNRIDQLKEKLSDITQKIAQLNGRKSYVIKSPRAGVINNLQAIEGQKAVSASAIPLLTLIPEEAKLIAHLLVPVRAIGFVEPGQNLEIAYDAFPYQRFGLYRGVIDSVSSTLMLPNEVLNVPYGLSEPVYKVTAHIQKQDISAYGKSLSLKSGMTLNAKISTGERSLIHWLFDPIYSLKGKM